MNTVFQKLKTVMTIKYLIKCINIKYLLLLLLMNKTIFQIPTKKNILYEDEEHQEHEQHGENEMEQKIFKKSKHNISFSKIVNVILIPSKEEYKEIYPNLWFTEHEIYIFRQIYINEIMIEREMKRHVDASISQ